MSDTIEATASLQQLLAAGVENAQLDILDHIRLALGLSGIGISRREGETTTDLVGVWPISWRTNDCHRD